MEAEDVPKYKSVLPQLEESKEEQNWSFSWVCTLRNGSVCPDSPGRNHLNTYIVLLQILFQMYNTIFCRHHDYSQIIWKPAVSMLSCQIHPEDFVFLYCLLISSEVKVTTRTNFLQKWLSWKTHQSTKIKSRKTWTELSLSQSLVFI